MQVAYFVNQYPKVSHSFIRREIMALERQGVEVVRLSLRGWDDQLVDPDDIEERQKTHYLLRGGLPGLLPALVRRAVKAPLAMCRALAQAYRMSRQSDRPLVYHLVYVAEACALIKHLEGTRARHVHAHFGTNSAEVVALDQAQALEGRGDDHGSPVAAVTGDFDVVARQAGGDQVLELLGGHVSVGSCSRS